MKKAYILILTILMEVILMANVLVQNAALTDIANAIREKNGSTHTYKPAEMAAAIRAIEGSGSGNSRPQANIIILPPQTGIYQTFYMGTLTFTNNDLQALLDGYSDPDHACTIDISNGSSLNASVDFPSITCFSDSGDFSYIYIQAKLELLDAAMKVVETITDTDFSVSFDPSQVKYVRISLTSSFNSAVFSTPTSFISSKVEVPLYYRFLLY